METLHLPLDLLRSLMFSFDEFWGERAISRIRSEPEPFYPVLVPLPIGKLLHDKDPTSQVFKVLVYPTHAEVWHIDHWRASASSKWNIVSNITSSTGYIYDKHEGALLHNIRQCIVTYLPLLADKSQHSALNALATALRRAPKETTDKIPGLTTLISQHTAAVEATVTLSNNSSIDLPYKCRMAFVQAVYPLTTKEITTLTRYTTHRHSKYPATPVNKLIGGTMITCNRHRSMTIFEDSTIIKYYENET